MSSAPWTADAFLTFATWDNDTHGVSDHRMYAAAATRMLALRPEIARESVFTAIVAGDLEEVRRRLTERPEAATEPGGPRNWTPILYLAFARLPHQPTIDHAVDIARELLDRGANPNDYYDACESKYTPLVGVAGGGEQDSPRQPQSQALFQLLLERGADPFDVQVLYNTHFHNDLVWWLELIHAHSMRTGREAAWADPDWAMLDMGAYGCGARFLLERAIRKDDLPLAEWVLAHGANPNAAPARDRRHSKRTLYEQAVATGQHEMAELLARHGATRSEPVLTGHEAIVAACMREDRASIESLVTRHPEYLTSPLALFMSAAANKSRAIEILLDLGTPIDIRESDGRTALHEAAGSDAIDAVTTLLARGADVDPIEHTYLNAPIGWAQHYEYTRATDLLSRHSTHIWALTFGGYVDRVREVLADNPSLATAVRSDDGCTPLWWLPRDEEQAVEIVRLLLKAGADPAVKNKEGNTAETWAMTMAMPRVAALIATAAS
jgi:ankyrin repeat protein